MKKRHNTKHDKKPIQSHKIRSVKHLIKVFMLYLVAAAAITGWIDYTSYGVFNPLWLLLAILATAIVATAIHWYTGQPNRIDDIAEGDL